MKCSTGLSAGFTENSLFYAADIRLDVSTGLNTGKKKTHMSGIAVWMLS